MKKTAYLTVIFIMLATSIIASENVPQWELFEKAFTASTSANPFTTVQFSAEFRFRNRILVTEGFYDGQGIYKIRFMPDTEGEWTYETKSNVREMNGKTGKFFCIAPLTGAHGPVSVRNTFDFGYADGTHREHSKADAKGKELAGQKFTVQVAPEDCTGCGACVYMCPALEKDANKQPTGRKAINMAMQEPLRESERENYDYFLSIPNTEAKFFKRESVKGSQLVMPLFEYSGACAGCGETAYIKLMTQLFGDRAMIGNATGCSSIYGGNLPTTPYTTREDGRGPIWSNSLFEDNSEFALGMRLTVDKFKQQAFELVDIVAKKGCIDAGLAGVRVLISL